MISLQFVFAAMAEFSLVLFVKQIQEWKNIETTKAGAVQVTADQETRNIPFSNGTCSKLHGLRLTTKIDLAGFVLFNFSYLIFNILYWAPVLDHFYEED